jgi:integrase/recombinase XerD
MRKGQTIARGRGATVPHILTANYTISQAFELFIHAKAAEGLRERTLRDYRDHQRWFADWLIETRPKVQMAQEISPQILREYIYYLTYNKQYYGDHPIKSKQTKERQGLSPGSINIRITTMKAYYKWLFNEGIITRNPAANIKKQRVEEDMIGAFTDEQAALLLDMPNQRRYAGFRDFVLMRLLLESGMRIGEITSLTTDAIDLKTRLITIAASVSKTRKARIIPISTKMTRLLMELVAENHTYFPDAKHVFLANYGQPLTESGISSRIKEYGKQAGIADKVRCSPHTFRHTFALNFLKENGDMVALQRILGHSSMDMVRKYVQHTSEDIRDAHDKFTQSRSKRLR